MSFYLIEFSQPIKITCLFAFVVTLEIFKVGNKLYLEMHIG
jgi:hypothetical protein